MKNVIIVGMVLLTANIVHAVDFIENGLGYNFLADSPESVTVAHGAAGCEHVVIPSRVTHEGKTYNVVEISEFAFLRYEEMKSLEIQEGVTTIGTDAFMYCTSLTEISFPKSLKTIKKDAFEYAWHIQDVHIADLKAWCSVEFSDFPFKSNYDIKHNLYLKGKLLTDITIDVDSISPSCFRGVKSIENVSIIGNLRTIPAYAFSECTSLKRITFPKALKYVKSYAFRRCESLSELNLPDSVENISSYAFESCTALTELYVPANIKSIGSRVFRYDDNITKMIYNARNIGFDSRNLSYDLKTLVETVVFGDSVVNIPSELCKEYTKIRQIKIPKNVKAIGTSAFASCSNLAEVTIEDGLVGIPSSCFSGCSSLKNVVIPSSVTKIGSQAFYNCSSLSQIILPDGIKDIPYMGFANCKSLNSLIIPPSVTYIGYGSFRGCTNLTDVVMSPNVETIDTEAFYKCEKLNDISVPKSIKEIFSYAFSETALTKFEFPENATLLSHSILNGCANLKVIEYNTKNAGWQSIFDGSLYKLIIGSGVTQIGSQKFKNCKAIDSIVVKASIPPTIAETTFNNEIYSEAVLNVPVGCLDAYKTAEVWKNFMIIEEPESSSLNSLSNSFPKTIYLNGREFQFESEKTAVSIYNITGMVASTLLEGESYTLSPGLYILKTDKRSYKIKID